MANDIPTFQKQVKPETQGNPDFQNTFERLGASQNSLSSIGSTVAISASNQIATRLGYEEGQHPHGDLMPPITDFDKNFANTYHTESASTLTIQADELFTKTDLELSNASRLTPALLEKANKSLNVGLTAMVDAAPTAIKGKLHESFSAQVLRMNEQNTKKMIAQQREDSKQTALNSIDIYVKQAYELSMNGQEEASHNAFQQAKATAQSAANNNYITPYESRVASETAYQSYLTGTTTRMALDAKANKKTEEFDQWLSEKPPHMTNEQHMTTISQVQNHMNYINSLTNQKENLLTAKFNTLIVEDPSKITGLQWSQYESEVSPLMAEETKVRWLSALKSRQSQHNDIMDAQKGFTNPEAMSRMSSDIKNKLFDANVESMVKSSGTANPLSIQNAQVQVAAAAGSSIPAFVQGLENKLGSGNPNEVESASKQIEDLHNLEADKALNGLSSKAKIQFEKYKSLRSAMPPADATKEMTAQMNQDGNVIKANKERWNNLIRTGTSAEKVSPTQFALKQVDYKTESFLNPSMAKLYGEDILSIYESNFNLANSDQKVALAVTKKYVEENFGKTYVNGKETVTLHPMEKLLGYKGSNVVPFIHKDLETQLTKKFETSKQMYDKNQAKEYWEVLPKEENTSFLGISSNSIKPVRVKQYSREKNKVTVNEYDVVLNGNSFDSWDVAVSSPTGMRNISQIAPYLGIISYTPNKKFIDSEFLKANPLK